MKKIFLVIALFVASFCSAQRIDSMKITVEQSWVYHKVIVYGNDTVQGKIRAVYANDTSITAYEKNFYNGKLSGVYRSYYPNGQLMERIVYMGGKKNGDYSFYSPEGKILIKGEYKYDVKQGYWADLNCKTFGHYRKGVRSGRWKWYYDPANKRKYYVYIYKKGALMKKEADVPECLLF
jgi:antitoxin component YwqK of YwqJK toxin-antitoxin module